MRSQQIAVIGSGYVGLTLSASLALLGHDVECTDKSHERVEQLAHGHVPITEEGLTEVVEQMLATGHLRFGRDNQGAARRAEFVFLCLPTPMGGDGWADLSFVKQVAEEIGPHLRPGATVITKSTVPVGTGQMVRQALGRDDVHVVSNPEFLAEGTALRDCLRPDRIVVGAASEAVARTVADLYGPFAHSRSILTDVASAEIIKYASNAYLAVRLTFVNSMAQLCELAGADVRAVTRGMGADRRIGPGFLQPGPGWGGSCFPKDTEALVQTAAGFGCDLALVQTAIATNAQHIDWVAGKVAAILDGHVHGKRIAMWGLTFKAGTDDQRQSPALAIARRLTEMGAVVHAYDPTVPAGTLHGIEVHSSSFSACKEADALVIATEWPEFAAADLTALAAVMGDRVIMDARNMIDPVAAVNAGFRYSGIGVPVQLRREEGVAV
ncbi:MAG: UDP-glucose/GDP-mannose dehydrogenase family protein [Actinobacteria bacterium]|nr:UDP-glucose/GDP-mannose dehydrogenase family protein [Actinomycetota bacterium]